MSIFCYITVIIILYYLLSQEEYISWKVTFIYWASVYRNSVITTVSVSFSSRYQSVQILPSNRCLLSTFLLLKRDRQGSACFLRPNFSQPIFFSWTKPIFCLCFSRFYLTFIWSKSGAKKHDPIWETPFSWETRILIF